MQTKLLSSDGMPEAERRPAKVPKPESLEAKFRLLAMLPYDRRAKRKHSLVFGFILDWYHSKYGDALASVRHVAATIKERDPFGAGLYAGDVHAALADLVAWGYLERTTKGTGQRASRYVPVWAKLDSVRKNANATDNEISVRENANTSVRENANATGDSVRETPNEDPSTVTRPQDGVTVKDGHDCAAPLAPTASGLEAAAAETAQEGFEELWRAYDYKKKKKEARAAYAKLAPNADLHAAMVASAKAWQASWAAQDKPGAPRFHLHKWIEREEYECDPPAAYKPKASPARPKRAANDNAPAIHHLAGKQRAEIVNSNYNEDEGLAVLEFSIGDDIIQQRLTLQHRDPEKQEEGQKMLGRLCRVLDIAEVEDTSQLHGIPLTVRINSAGAVTGYDAIPADEEAAA